MMVDVADCEWKSGISCLYLHNNNMALMSRSEQRNSTTTRTTGWIHKSILVALDRHSVSLAGLAAAVQ